MDGPSHLQDILVDILMRLLVSTCPEKHESLQFGIPNSIETISNLKNTPLKAQLWSLFQEFRNFSSHLHPVPGRRNMQRVCSQNSWSNALSVRPDLGSHNSQFSKKTQQLMLNQPSKDQQQGSPMTRTKYHGQHWPTLDPCKKKVGWWYMLHLRYVSI